MKTKIKNFKSKEIKVQDYPDKAFKITIFGKSKTSKFKLNDSVVVVNNGRIGYDVQNIIGFDDDGDAMLDNCSWCNTRGGYSDDTLVLNDLFITKLDCDLLNENGKPLIEHHYKWQKERNEYKGIDKKLEDYIKFNELTHNWDKYEK